MAGFLFLIVNGLLQLMVWVLIANAIISWLVAFDVINLRNRIAYNVAHILERLSRPILAPFQRFIPTFGGIDISPILAILIIWAARIALVPKILLLQPYIG